MLFRIFKDRIFKPGGGGGGSVGGGGGGAGGGRVGVGSGFQYREYLHVQVKV